ncbi:hypothetical protein [Rhodopseudomonas palustris]|uniref:Uncharacterized protein n=1 Tax=Rhodopseudomonas palustris (strain ATCC BAA-98 / CGA009) TaxID=258594 RepID=Q6N2Y5_RHOPA|nr:hypothetical protein [Rhodopseudomonas palustris]OPF92667.1 hypothetical protein B1S06_16060 [Rhodopseudomonas palustris]PPQ43358.1 hypothetical protein CKO39_11345 [Rhodopseudomonas palustris]QQM05471.1 hypothetical protein I8G32_04040 [Rhodopseudomonas palustris]RJF63232.1 hypothetical protein D4Q71_15640 [Rhodopseudomonas palustris]WAB76809.1 hypothetical protein OR798_20285 [Rhodopseudomonas palustris]
MSIDFTIKPVGAPVITPILRPEPEAAQAAVPTDLPAPQSVTAADGGSATTATKTGSNSASSISRQVIFDQAAAEMVYVAVDQNTQSVISQYPDSWQLKARAYFRELDQSKPQRIGSHATDRVA